jgi:hypothetical protein
MPHTGDGSVGGDLPLNRQTLQTRRLVGAALLVAER